MEYSVRLTDYAIDLMGDIVDYISHQLQAPAVAQKWSDYLKAEIAGLSFMPARYKLVDAEPWHSKGVHSFAVKNYIVYYYISESDKTVWVTAILYGRRNQLAELQKMPI